MGTPIDQRKNVLNAHFPTFLCIQSLIKYILFKICIFENIEEWVIAVFLIWFIHLLINAFWMFQRNLKPWGFI